MNLVFNDLDRPLLVVEVQVDESIVRLPNVTVAIADIYSKQFCFIAWGLCKVKSPIIRSFVSKAA